MVLDHFTNQFANSKGSWTKSAPAAAHNAMSGVFKKRRENMIVRYINMKENKITVKR
jgi:hypothetical protein